LTGAAIPLSPCTFAKLAGLTEAQAAKIFAQVPVFPRSSEAFLTKRIAQLKKTLALSADDFERLVLRNPVALFSDPAALKGNLRAFAARAELPLCRALRLALNWPRLLTLRKNTLALRIRTFQKLLGLTRRETARLLRKYPVLLLHSPTFLETRTRALISLLGLPRTSALKLIKAQPTLYSFNPETLARRIQTNASFLKITPECLIATSLRQPRLLLMTPEKLAENVKTLSALFQLTPAAYIALGQRRPQLFCFNAARFGARLPRNARALQLKLNELIEIARRRPDVLIAAPSTLATKREALLQLARLCQGDYTFPAILAKNPTTITYSLAYIGLRCDLASRLCEKPNMFTLLALPNAKVTERLKNFA